MPLDWLIIGAMLIVRRCIVKIEIHEMTLKLCRKKQNFVLAGENIKSKYCYVMEPAENLSVKKRSWAQRRNTHHHR